MRAQPQSSNPLLRSGFSPFSAAVLRDRELSIGARLTYADLVFRAFLERSEVLEDVQEELAGDLGISVRSLRVYLTELRKKELIETRRQGRGLPNVVEIRDPRAADSADLDRSNLPPRAAKSAALRAGASEGRPLKSREEETALERSSSRAQDPVWDVLVELYGPVATPPEESRRGMIVRDLKAAMPDLDGEEQATEIQRRAELYRTRPPWRDLAFTDTALYGRWGSLGELAKDVELSKVDPVERWIEGPGRTYPEQDAIDMLTGHFGLEEEELERRLEQWRQATKEGLG